MGPRDRGKGPVTDPVRERPRRHWRDSAGPAVAGMPRLFFAVPLPEHAGERIASLVDDVRAAVAAGGAPEAASARWVRMDGLHLTLRFLGPTPEADVPELTSILDALAPAHDPASVTVRGAGAFPSPERPRTLWLGLTGGVERLTALADDLGTRLVGAGWPQEERPFRAHLTLARADGRRAGPAAARALIARAAGFRLAFEMDRIVLFESVTGGGPARYVALHEARLGGSRDALQDAPRPAAGVPSGQFATSAPVKSVPDRRSPGSS